MARKKKVIKREYVPGEFDQGIMPTDVIDYTRKKLSAYGFTVVVSRAFESIEDGLIPVRRKILWYLYHDRHSNANSGYVKVPEIIYPTAKYYAHGQMSLENTFDNMIQWWDTNADILDIAGNQGSMTGDTAAAVRYLECRMTKYAWKCFFEEFDPTVVDMVRNYIDTDDEPLWLPSRYPNFMLSTNMGIAWAYAAKYPTFNLTEAFDLTKAMIRNPDMTDVYLFPDSPRGYEVIDDGTAPKVCAAGYGGFPIRAAIRPEWDDERNAYNLVIDGWPEGIFMDKIIAEIRDRVKDRKIMGVQDCADRSHKRDTILEVQLKPSVDPNYMMQELFKKTSLQTKAHMNYNFSMRTRKDLLSLGGAIRYWINTRVDVKFRLMMRKLQELQKRESQLDALLAITSDKEYRKIDKIITSSNDIDEAIHEISRATSLNTFQAEVISNMTLKQRTISSRMKLQEEYDLIPGKIKSVEDIVRSKDRIEDVICDELDEGIDLFGKPRNCKIIKVGSIKEITIQHRVIITKRYIKKMNIGGKNLIGNIDKTDDLIANFGEVSDTDKIVVISSNGKCYRINPANTQGCDAVHKGTPLLDEAGMPGEAVFAIQFTNNEGEYGEKELMLFTDKGLIKSSLVEQYRKCKGDSPAISLNDGDIVRFALIYDPVKDAGRYMNIYTRMGMSVAWNLSQVTRTDRNTKGSRYIDLEDDDIVGICNESSQILTMTRKGYGKICDYDEMFTSDKRKPKFQRITKLGDGDELFQVIPLTPEMERYKLNVYLASGSKVEIAIKDIKRTTRISKGFKLVKLPNGDSIVKIKVIE